MEFAGMPSYWCDCYYPGFKKVNRKYGLELSEEKIETAAKIMTEYNPRVNIEKTRLRLRLFLKPQQSLGIPTFPLMKS